MSSKPHIPEDWQQLAAEYALGVLESDDLAQAQSLERLDPAFREEVARWTGRLAPMLDAVEPLTPPVALYAAIERRLGSGAQTESNVDQLRRRLNRWRAFSGGVTALAASLALALLVRPPVDAPVASPASPPMVAMIEGSGGAAKLVATWDAADRRLMVVPALVPAGDQQHSHELWVIPADGKPRSMGVMPTAGPMQMEVPSIMAEQLAEGATLAVSVEPAGGSPTGLPTGPVVASGKLARA